MDAAMVMELKKHWVSVDEQLPSVDEVVFTFCLFGDTVYENLWLSWMDKDGMWHHLRNGSDDDPYMGDHLEPVWWLSLDAIPLPWEVDGVLLPVGD